MSLFRCFYEVAATNLQGSFYGKALERHRRRERLYRFRSTSYLTLPRVGASVRPSRLLRSFHLE